MKRCLDCKHFDGTYWAMCARREKVVGFHPVTGSAMTKGASSAMQERRDAWFHWLIAPIRTWRACRGRYFVAK